jgi:esterase/lipase superfamily enzyme
VPEEYGVVSDGDNRAEAFIVSLLREAGAVGLTEARIYAAYARWTSGRPSSRAQIGRLLRTLEVRGLISKSGRSYTLNATPETTNGAPAAAPAAAPAKRRGGRRKGAGRKKAAGKKSAGGRKKIARKKIARKKIARKKSMIRKGDGSKGGAKKSVRETRGPARGDGHGNGFYVPAKRSLSVDARRPQRPPVARTDAGEPVVPIFYTTERRLAAEAPPTFAKRSDWDARRFGRGEVRFPRSYKVTPPVGDLLYAVLVKLQLNQKRKPWIHEHHLFDEPTFYGNLRDEFEKANSRDLLVYVHGATVDLEGGILQAAIVAVNTNFPGPTIAYCWPASDYVTDVELAPQEARHFGKWLQSIQQQFPDANVHVVAHSLGSVVAMKGIGEAPVGLRIGEFTVAAPDIERRVYAELAPLVLAKAARGTIYVSKADAALFLSGAVRSRVARVGASVKDAMGHGFDVVDAAKHGGDGTFIQHDVAFRGPLCRDLAETLRGFKQIRSTLEENPPGAGWYQVRE